MAEKSLDDLFLDTLKDVYYAERKILRALPKLARGAASEELKAAFLKHRDETTVHIERLQQVFEMLGKRAQGKTCPAIEGILDEGEEILDEYKGTAALDAGLISAAQAVEHYEIARYGTLHRWAQQLGMQDVAGLLEETLSEEKATDEALSGLAESGANTKAKGARPAAKGQEPEKQQAADSGRRKGRDEQQQSSEGNGRQQGGGNFADDRERASEAGRKGGQR